MLKEFLYQKNSTVILKFVWYQNQLEGLLKQTDGPHPRISDLVGLE